MPLYIQNNQLILSEKDHELWSLNLNEIKLIGEYTTDQGPFLDDYFFVFADTKDNLLQASNMQIEDSNFWTAFGEALNYKMAPDLFASTEWNTNIMFPVHLKGQPLFDIKEEINKNRNWFQKLLGIGKTKHTIELTENGKSVFD